MIGLQLGSINTAMLPGLARLVADQKPDWLLLLAGPPGPHAAELASGGEADKAVAALHGACPVRIDL